MGALVLPMYEAKRRGRNQLVMAAPDDALQPEVR